MNEKQIFEALGILKNDEVNETERNKYLLTEEEQDRAIIKFLEELSQQGKIPLSADTKKYATRDALCGAQFIKAYNALYDKWIK